MPIFYKLPQLTPYFKTMGTKFLKIFFAFLLLSSLQSCPNIGEGLENCNNVGCAHPDLIKITPLKTTYSQGEVITYSITIPAENDYCGTTDNLYLKTGVTNAWLVASSYLPFSGNQVTYIKGSKRSGAENWFNVAYNPNTGNYEFEAKIKLNQTGNYSFISAEYVDFIGTPKCNKNSINTNIEGMNANGKIEFLVQ